MPRGKRRRALLLATAAACMLPGQGRGEGAPPPPETLRAWVRAGRIADAQPALEAALAGDAPGWLVAADGLVEAALRQDRPWLVRRRWLAPSPVGLAPAARRDLVVLELDLALRREDAIARLAARRPSTWTAEFPRVLALGERYLPRQIRRDQLLSWVRELGGPGRAGPELVAALGEVLEETGEIPRAGSVYRRALRSWDPAHAGDPWSPLTEAPGSSTVAARLRRTHSSPRARALLRQDLEPDENLGWTTALRGWMRRAWALHAVGLREEAAVALTEAGRRLPPGRLRPRLVLAGLCLRLDHPSQALRLYRECLTLPAGPGDRGVQTARGRGRVLALLAAAAWLRGDPTEAARTLARATRTGARVDDLATLLLDAPSGWGAHEALADLADLDPSAGLGLVAARSLTALHRHQRALQVLEDAVREAPTEIAANALAILWTSAEPARAPAALPGSLLATRSPERAMEILVRGPPGGLARTAPGREPLEGAAEWATSLPTPWSPAFEALAIDALLTWRHHLSPGPVAAMEARLTVTGRDVVRWTTGGEAPETAAAPWVARHPSRPLLERALDLAVGRNWQQWGARLVAAIVAQESSPELLAAAHRAAGALAARRDDGEGVILAGLRALEAVPGHPRTLALLTEHLEVRPAHRRILQAWAAHVENDPRYALSLRVLWQDTGRPRRALGPLLRARHASPRDGEVAAATGRLLMDEGREGEALTHLLAAARLGHFAHSPAYAIPLARALTHAGHPDRARKLYRRWLRQDRDGEVARELSILGAETGVGDLARRGAGDSDLARGD